jgi:hypothetical protein
MKERKPKPSFVVYHIHISSAFTLDVTMVFIFRPKLMEWATDRIAAAVHMYQYMLTMTVLHQHIPHQLPHNQQQQQ